jgi:hypothetical protein
MSLPWLSSRQKQSNGGMMSKIIIIAGDSWGCGEWKSNNISHSGITKHLIESGQFVINLSQPGGSNTQSADRVTNFLKVNSHYQVSKIIVFQTEWTRDIFAEDVILVSEDSKHGYHYLKNRMISRFYYKLSTASLENNIPIYVVGGCSDTIWFDKFAIEYPGVEIICQSLTNLLLNNNHRNLDPVHSVFTNEQVITYIKKHTNIDLELLLQKVNKGQQRLKQWETNKKYFWPDGVHPNQFAHTKLFEFLKTQIPDL